MIRVSVYKEIFESYTSRPFNVEIDKLQELRHGVYKIDAPHPIISGSYVANEKQCIAWELENIREKVISKINKECKMLIFTHTYINTIKTKDIDDENKQLVEDYMRLYSNQKKDLTTKEVIGIEDFKAAIDLLKDKEKFSNLIPFDIECIAVAVPQNSNEDRVMSEDISFCIEIEAPNGNMFNIYTLDYTN